MRRSERERQERSAAGRLGPRWSSGGAWLGLAAVALLACKKPPRPDLDDDAPPPWASSQAEQPARPGMAWIPPGTLLAGTPPERWPRVADVELPGTPIPLGGFYIDLYPHPNEAGTIPTSNLDLAMATSLCERQGKRLCSELELERACKGERGRVYPYGDDYQREVCATAARRGIPPNGFNAGCKSEYGVADLQGSVAVWTSSPWGRGTEGLVTVRGGGAGPHGEVYSRCAHARGLRPDQRAVELGVRCCFGPTNDATVELSVTRGEPLRYRPGDEARQRGIGALVHRMRALEEGAVSLADEGGGSAEARAFEVERVWVWHPLGNEELWVAGGCSALPSGKRCGALVAREVDGAWLPLAWVSSERWQPTLSESQDARQIHLQGGDVHGAFRKRVAYDWGRIGIGEPERKKKRGKGKAPSWD